MNWHHDRSQAPRGKTVVKRYDSDTDGHYGLISAVMREEPDGEYVKYSDYEALLNTVWAFLEAVSEIAITHHISPEDVGGE